MSSIGKREREDADEATEQADDSVVEATEHADDSVVEATEQAADRSGNSSDGPTADEPTDEPTTDAQANTEPTDAATDITAAAADPQRDTTLDVSDLTKAYGDTVALRDVDFSVADGEFVTVVGPSGCGKSTLLRVLTGLEETFEGTAEVDGTDVRAGGSDDVGMVFQEPRLLPWASVRENVAIGLDDSDPDRVDELIAQVGLDGFEEAKPGQLSGGMAQRVSLARGLAYEPEVLLLDEPFSALDALTKYEQQDFLLDVWKDLDATVVLVTHDIEEAAYLSDRVVVLGGQPGSVERVIDIDAARPRERTDERLVELRGEITEALGL